MPWDRDEPKEGTGGYPGTILSLLKFYEESFDEAKTTDDGFIPQALPTKPHDHRTTSTYHQHYTTHTVTLTTNPATGPLMVTRLEPLNTPLGVGSKGSGALAVPLLV